VKVALPNTTFKLRYIRNVMNNELTCEWCGKQFLRAKSRGPIPKYCSMGHRQRASEVRRTGRVATAVLRLNGVIGADGSTNALQGKALSPSLGLSFDIGRILGGAKMMKDLHRNISLISDSLSFQSQSSLIQSANEVARASKSFSETIEKVSLGAQPLGSNFELLGNAVASQMKQDAAQKALLSQLAPEIMISTKFLEGVTRALEMPLVATKAVSRALADLGRIALTPQMVGAIDAYKSAALMKSMLPDSVWLEAASRITSPSIGLANLPLLADSIAYRATVLAESSRMRELVLPSFDSAIGAWGQMVVSLPSLPSPMSLERLALGGTGTMSVLNAVSTFEQIGVEDDSVVQVTVDSGRERFYDFLTGIDDGLVRRWKGAWERIEIGGSDAASQAAHSVIETIDWILRTIVKDKDVLAWHAGVGRLKKELNDGRPTRNLRMCYLLRNRPEEIESGEAMVGALVKIMSVLQSKKHGGEPGSLDALRRLLPGLEAMLFFVAGYEHG
jgi:hypothetical protein